MTAANAALDALQDLIGTLSPSDRARIDLMERVRAQRVATDDRDDAVSQTLKKHLEELAMRRDPKLPRGPGNRSETRALVLTGKSGAGKSSLLTRTLTRHELFNGYGIPQSGCRALTVLTPSPCSPKALGLEILRALDYELSAERTLSYIWSRVRDRIQDKGILLLHLDEIHSVLQTANATELTQIRFMMKTFLVSPDWPIVLVLSGHPEVVPFLEGPTEFDENGRPNADSKGEMRRRCRFVHLRSLALPQDAEMIAGGVTRIAQVAGMSVPSDLRNVIVPRLAHAALYELGTAMEIAHEAVGIALEDTVLPNELGLDLFRRAYRSRTGSSDVQNPFAAVNWRAIDCTFVLKENQDAADAAKLTGEIAAERKAAGKRKSKQK